MFEMDDLTFLEKNRFYSLPLLSKLPSVRLLQHTLYVCVYNTNVGLRARARVCALGKRSERGIGQRQGSNTTGRARAAIVSVNGSDPGIRTCSLYKCIATERRQGRGRGTVEGGNDRRVFNNARCVS